MAAWKWPDVLKCWSGEGNSRDPNRRADFLVSGTINESSLLPPALVHSTGTIHSFWLIKKYYKTWKAKHNQTASETCIGN